MNSRVTGIEDTDLLILVGTNPRLENPVLNARIRKAFGVNGLEIVHIGSAPAAGYEYIHLGNSPSTLQELADGNHPYFERLQKAELPMILVSAATLQRADGAAILNNINKLANKTNLINKAEGWNGVNVL